LSMYSSRINVFIRAVDEASSTLKSVGENVRRLAKTFDFLRDAAKYAMGQVLADSVKTFVNFVGSSAEAAGKLETLKMSFERLVKASGATNLSLESLRKATKGAVSDIELLQAANQALMLGVPADKLNELFEAAMKLGYATGQSATKSIQDLTTALGRQSPRILDNLGITFEAAAAYEWYAQKIGTTTDKLTENQKKLAWQEYAMMQVSNKANELGDNISDAQLKIDQYKASVENSKVETGKFTEKLVEFGDAVRQYLGPVGDFVALFAPDMMQGFMLALANQVIPRVITKLGALAEASWAVAIAEKARAIASAIAAAVTSWGTAVPIILGAAAVVTAGLAMHFAGIFQEGGVVPRTGWAYVHKGEVIIPPEKMKLWGGVKGPLVHIDHITVASDYDVDRMMERIILRLKQRGVPFD